MNVLDLSISTERQKVPPGTVLFLQGRMAVSFLVLHSGMAEIMSTDSNPEEHSVEEIIEDSIRVGLVKGESICGILGLYNNEPFAYSILAISECIVSNKPIEQKLIVPALQQNMKLNLQVLQALIQRVESAIFLFRNYRYLWHKFASIQDSIAIGADIRYDRKTAVEQSRYRPNVKAYAAYISNLLDKQGGNKPKPWSSSVFGGSLQDKLDLYAQYDNLRLEEMIDHSQYLFIKRLLNKQGRLVAALFYKDGPTNFYVFQFLGSTLDNIVKYNRDIVRNIGKLIRLLYADKGWVAELIKLKPNNDHAYTDFMQQLWKYSSACQKDASKLLSVDLPKQYPVYKKLLSFRASSESRTDARTSPSEVITPEIRERLRKYNGLMAKILKFSEKPREFKDEFTDIINRLKALDDIHSSAKEDIALRARFITLYWELYETCFLRIIDSDLKSFIPGIMLHFGLVDEEMVNENELAVIDEAYSCALALDDPIPVMTLPYFLEKIYTGTVNPSLNDSGEYFRDVLKRQEKMTAKARAAAGILYSDKPEDKVRYEIHVITRELTRVVYGSKEKSLPVLSSQSLIGNIDRLFFSPEKCSEIVQEYHNRDFSLFYREVVCKHRFGTDIVKNEVRPHFIIYPVAGSRVMMWQELDGTRKDTPARFVLPMYYMGKFNDDIGAALAHFRWEISRTSAGSSWMDPVEGGLSGAYYDYLAFYKRNPKLSSTHKENIKNFIKKTRSERERFAADYITWVLFEHDGKIRFNPVARDIFYRFVPFRKEMRNILAQKPLYTDFDTMRKNRTQKEVLRLETRFKRFEKAGEAVPPEMKQYMEFLLL